MYKIITISLLLVCFSNNLITAQQNPKAARTNALMSLDAYKIDRTLYKELKKSQENIDYACSNNPTGEEPKTWKYKGEIYMYIAFEEKLKKDYPTAALQSYESWIKALEMDEAKLIAKGKPVSKVPTKAEYKEGLEAIGNALYNSGIDAINSGGYEKGYAYFNSIVTIKKKAASVFGEKPPVFQFKETDAQRMAALGALKLGKLEEGETMLNAQIAKNEISAELLPTVYNSIAEAYITAKQTEKGRNVLAEARKKYPTNKDLLYTEINLALAENRLSELEVQLKQAIESDPNNVELWFVLGNMYDGLFRERLKPADKNSVVSSIDEKSGMDFFKKAEETYKKSMAINPKHYNSQYGIGVLYANYANYCVKKVSNLNPKDESYNQWSKNQTEAVEKSLSLLLEAERIEPNNLLGLEALKAIYGLKSDSAKFAEYKEKIAKAANK